MKATCRALDSFLCRSAIIGMNGTDPRPLTNGEWKEIMGLPAVRDYWGIEGDMTISELSACVYAAHFTFQSGGPGDLYILQGDTLTDEGPLVLRRDDRVCSYWFHNSNFSGLNWNILGPASVSFTCPGTHA
jgi:hypothetical protein